MKKIILTILLFLPLVSFGAIVRVQAPAGNNCGSVTSCTIAFGSNNTAGNFIAVISRYATNGLTTTISDTRTNTYNFAVKREQPADSNGSLEIWYAMNIAAGANTVTFATSGGANIKRFIIAEYSSVATTGALDQTNSAVAASTAPASGTVTPTQDGELFIAGGFSSGTRVFTAGTDFTMITTVGGDRLAAEDYVQPTATTHNGNFTLNTSDAWAAVVATFKPATGEATTPKGYIMSGSIMSGSI